MSKTVQLAIEPVASRMEDKQTRFQLAPAAHMMTARIDLPEAQAKLVQDADMVKKVYEAFCRAVTVGEPIEPHLKALDELIGSPTKKAATPAKSKTSAKGASAATSKQAATSEQTSSSDDAEAQSDPSEG